MKPGRPLEFDPDAALEKAMEVFWGRGYEGASLQNLLDAMSLSKSSFYQVFGGKHQLFERCIERFRDKQVARLREGLREAPSGRAFIESRLRALADEARGPDFPRGCLIMNTATEFAGRDPVIARLILKSAEKLTGVFAEAVRRAQREGDMPMNRDSRVLALYVMTSIGGLRAMVKAGASPEMIDAIAGVTMRAFD